MQRLATMRAGQFSLSSVSGDFAGIRLAAALFDEGSHPPATSNPCTLIFVPHHSSSSRVPSPLEIDLEGHRGSGSNVLCFPVDFLDKAGLHVDNKPPHRNFFGDPRV